MTSVVKRACERCKAQHKKCSGTYPCERCLEAHETCEFPYLAEEDVFEIIDKQYETLKIQQFNNEQAKTLLKTDQQQKTQELAKMHAKIAQVRNKVSKFFSIPNLSIYVYWYSQIISALTGTKIPYPDLETFLQDDGKS
jgi:hypothetical protein